MQMAIKATAKTFEIRTPPIKYYPVEYSNILMLTARLKVNSK